MKTKKVGASGKFGARYGKKIRKDYAKAVAGQSNAWECPKCMKNRVRRLAAGVWECSACKHRFAGKAYKPA
jgi:large subunit ribosomal protein L37Ae